ncbi:MAG TPA: ABC transporter ATP-binding protein [Solirubrobacteraceae bacterium]|nr:ABC transporter ATP-binding protein [Solirubrobacteraceae bacterium]
MSKRYGELVALRDVSFELCAGEVLAIVGPNGAGKTTLLSIVAGTQSATAGSVHANGAAEASRSARAQRAAVGWAPQQAALYSRLTVAENLRLFARLERVADPERAVERMLDQTELRARADDRVGRLSGGNRQRVNVALALLADPPVLALDEPSASLDPAQRERLWEFIKGLARSGHSVIFSSHNMAEVQRHADRVIVLDRGEQLFDGAPAELMRTAGDGDRSEIGQRDLESALVAFVARSEREQGIGE